MFTSPTTYAAIVPLRSRVGGGVPSTIGCPSRCFGADSATRTHAAAPVRHSVADHSGAHLDSPGFLLGTAAHSHLGHMAELVGAA